MAPKLSPKTKYMRLWRARNRAKAREQTLLAVRRYRARGGSINRTATASGPPLDEVAYWKNLQPGSKTTEEILDDLAAINGS